MIKNLIKKILLKIRVISGKELNIREEITIPKLLLGNENANWFVGDYLDRNSTVYSFGVGKDISFDIALIQKFNCIVFAFDPTPESAEWISHQSVPDNFRFFENGISNKDGLTDFYLPLQSGHISHSLVKKNNNGRKIKVSMKRLTTIMEELGHSEIDVIKMDIEGAEYEVIEEILENDLDVKQILVEFHHRFKEINISKTKKTIDKLNKKNYRLFAISPSLEEYSFIKV